MRRRRARKAAQCLAAWAIGVASAFGQQAGPAGDPPAEPGRPAAARRQAPEAARGIDPRKMGWLLQQWEKQSTLLKTLDVTLLRIDDSPAWGDVEYYEGRALFKSPNLAFINFKKIKQDENKKPMKDPADPKRERWLSTDYERIVCTGQEVWQYKSDTQQIFVFPLNKDEQKKAVEEGPLPFLFNMKADEARARYQMNLMDEDAKGYVVSIKPKLAEDKESFSAAQVKLDRRYLLPVRIVLVSPDGKSSKDFRLGPMTPNRPVNEKNFVGRPIGPPWKVIHNPDGEERPRAGAGRPRREAPAEPAAARPRAPGLERR